MARLSPYGENTMSAMPPGITVTDAVLNMFPYSFTLRNERGTESNFRFSSFVSAWDRSLANGRPHIYFRDSDGHEHLCKNIPGQEGRRTV